MSSASSAVTYTSVYTDSEPGRVFWGVDKEPSDGGPPRVIVYGYDRLPIQAVAPPSPDKPGPLSTPHIPPITSGTSEHATLHSIYLPYVLEPEYPEYLAPSDDEAPMEDQPLPDDASLVALSPGYVPDSDPKEDPEEDFEEEHVDYPVDGGDGDNEPSDDDDTDDEDEEPFEDEGDDEEEEEHLAPADSSAIPVVDPVPSAVDTKAFETDESAPIPRSSQIRVPFSQTYLCRAWKTVRLEPPMSSSMKARISKYAAAPIPPLLVASPPLPLPSPLTTSPTDAGAPLGYRVEMPPRKRACFATPCSPYFYNGEFMHCAARHQGLLHEPTLRMRFVEAIGTEDSGTIQRSHMTTERLSESTSPHHYPKKGAIFTATQLWPRDREAYMILTTALGRIETLEARDPEPQDGPAEAGSSC
ncbi:hypothetical protein Tco_0809954 [Tanacetum coccineum]